MWFDNSLVAFVHELLHGLVSFGGLVLKASQLGQQCHPWVVFRIHLRELLSVQFANVICEPTSDSLISRSVDCEGQQKYFTKLGCIQVLTLFLCEIVCLFRRVSSRVKSSSGASLCGLYSGSGRGGSSLSGSFQSVDQLVIFVLHSVQEVPLCHMQTCECISISPYMGSHNECANTFHPQFLILKVDLSHMPIFPILLTLKAHEYSIVHGIKTTKKLTVIL